MRKRDERSRWVGRKILPRIARHGLAQQKIFSFWRLFHKGFVQTDTFASGGKFLAGGLLAALWAYALIWAASGYPIYRDQHLGAALQYAKEGVDLFRPVIPGFNATGTGTPQEFPIWQACASYGLRLGKFWWGSSTLVSLLLFSFFLYFFWKSAKDEGGEGFSWLAVAFLLSQPLLFHLAGGAQTDGYCLGLLFLFVWSSEALRKKGSWKDFLICAMAASLLAVTKLPFLLVGTAAAGFRTLFFREGSFRSWAGLLGVGLVAFAVFWPWNLWCEQEISRALFRCRLLTFREIPEWFLGSWEYRLDPANYLKAGWRALSCLWGSFVLVGLTLYGLWKNPRSLGACLFYGAIITTLIFTKLVLIHRHYYLMFSPAIALLNSSALISIFPKPKRWLLLVAAPLLLLSLGQGLINIEVVATSDPYPNRIASIILANTAPSEKLLVLGGGWGGDIFLRSQRTGLSVDDTSWADNPETCLQLRRLGYTKFVWISESPLLHALQVSNPGGAARARERFPVRPPSTTASWPIVFLAEDIVIKELPSP